MPPKYREWVGHAVDGRRGNYGRGGWAGRGQRGRGGKGRGTGLTWCEADEETQVRAERQLYRWMIAGDGLRAEEVQSQSTMLVLCAQDESQAEAVRRVLLHLRSAIRGSYETYRQLIVCIARSVQAFVWSEELAGLLCDVVQYSHLEQLKSRSFFLSVKESMQRAPAVVTASNESKQLRELVEEGLARLPAAAMNRDNGDRRCRTAVYATIQKPSGMVAAGMPVEDRDRLLALPSNGVYLAYASEHRTEELPVVQIGVPIEQDHAETHVFAQFQLLRADCSMGLIEALTQVQQSANALNLHAPIRRGDPTRAERSLVEHLRRAHGRPRQIPVCGVRCIGVSFNYTYGALYAMQVAQAPRGAKSLLTGNLVLLSVAYFDTLAAPTYVGVLRPTPSQYTDNNASNSHTRHVFCVEIVSQFGPPLAFADAAFRFDARFTLLESPAFLNSYEAALKSLRSRLIQWINLDPAANLPLSISILEGNTDGAPQYVVNSPRILLDKSVAVTPGAGATVNLLSGPECWGVCETWTLKRELALASEGGRVHVLDETQNAALHHIFSHRLAIVQGTPGTGKTFVGAKFVQILLDNERTLEPGPVLVMSLTNNATDSFLEEIMGFTGAQTESPPPFRVVRLGGGGKKPRFPDLQLPREIIKATPAVYEIRSKIEAAAKDFRLSSQRCDEVVRSLPRLADSLERALLRAVSDCGVQLRSSRTREWRSNFLDMMKFIYALMSRDDATVDEGVMVKRMSSCFANVTPQTVWTVVSSVLFVEPLLRTTVRELLGIWKVAHLRSHGLPGPPEVLQNPQNYNPSDCWSVLHHRLACRPETVDAATVARVAEHFATCPAMPSSSRQAVHKVPRATPHGDADVDRVAAEMRQELLARRMEGVAAADDDSDFIPVGPEENAAALRAFIIQTEELAAELTRMQPNTEFYLTLTEQQRSALLCTTEKWTKLQLQATLKGLMGERNCQDALREYRQTVNQRKVAFLRTAKVIAGTVNGVMNELEALRLVGIRVMVVEEAAEVLEGSIISLLTQHLEHLVLIGDHKQLSPKVEEHELDRHKGLGVSLQERLILSGAPYVTLTTQRRMHPDLSVFVHSYYARDEDSADQPVVIVDHPRTFSIPAPMGVRDELRAFLVDYNASETQEEQRHEATLSYSNPYELSIVLGIVRNLLRYNRGKSIIVLTPYAGQLLNLKARLHSISEDVKVHTIDDFQGDEGDFIVLSMVRTTYAGFLSRENRACVALSRARMGCYMVGCSSLLAHACSIYKEFALRMAASGRSGSGFPGYCELHQKAFTFSSNEEYDRLHCRAECGMMLPCGHGCGRSCHGRDHEGLHCIKPCGRVGVRCTPQRTCDHPCTGLCFEPCASCPVLTSVLCEGCGTTRDMACGTVERDMLLSNCTSRVAVGVDDTLCGHEIMVPCWVRQAGEVDRYTKYCRQRCGEHMPCGHVCPLKCHAGDDDANHERARACCTQVLHANRPDCGHPSTRKCSDNPMDSTKYSPCSESCTIEMPCGHPCRRRCGHKGSCDCGSERSKVCVRCKATQVVPCAEYSTSLCQQECRAMLPCHHRCKQRCGACPENAATNKWARHAPCENECGKALPCGHVCKEGCGRSPCGLCTSPCSYTCGHGQPCAGRHACFECRAMLCQERCVWSCEHFQCNKPCGEVCDRPPCNARCPKHLPCGHQCFGLCGEVCPSHCPECYNTACESRKELAPADPSDASPLAMFHVDMVYVLDAAEAEEYLRGRGAASHTTDTDYRLVELQCCKRLTLVGFLDGHFAAAVESGRQGEAEIVRMIVCPLCSSPLWPAYYRRQSAEIKRRLKQILALSQKIEDLEAQRRATQSSALEQWTKAVEGLQPCPTGSRKLLLELNKVKAAVAPLRRPPLLPKSAKKKRSLEDYSRQRQYEVDCKQAACLEAVFVDGVLQEYAPRLARTNLKDLLCDVLFKSSTPADVAVTVQLMDLILAVISMESFLRRLRDETVGCALENRRLLRAACLTGGSFSESLIRVISAMPQRQELLRPLEVWVVQVHLVRLWVELHAAAGLYQLTDAMEMAKRIDMEYLNPLPANIAERVECKNLLSQLVSSLSRECSSQLRQVREQTTSTAFLQMIARAIGEPPGKWYMCRNGHLYTIGDCGGAMEEAHCAECKEVIGGKAHRVHLSNRFAGELLMSGARPSWPQ